MSTLVVATLKSNSSSPPAFQNTSGTEVGTLCRAWVNFNGTGTVAIRAQFNVSSITDNGQGDYTVNFTNAMPDTNFVVSGHGSGGTPTNSSNYNRVLEGSPNTSSSARCLTYAPNNTVMVDLVYCSVAIFR